MLYQYDPKNVTVVACGIPITGGWAKGSFVKVSMYEDAFSTTVGADGAVTRNRSRNATGSIEITLQHGSPMNDLLSAVHQLDLNTGNGVAPSLMKLMNGTTLWASQNTWIKKMPDMEYGEEDSTVTWTIDCDNLVGFVGGHS